MPLIMIFFFTKVDFNPYLIKFVQLFINNQITQKKMKKFLSLFIAAGLFSLVACGPAAEEATQVEDIQAETEVLMDQLEATEVEDSTEEVAEEATEGEVVTEEVAN